MIKSKIFKIKDYTHMLILILQHLYQKNNIPTIKLLSLVDIIMLSFIINILFLEHTSVINTIFISTIYAIIVILFLYFMLIVKSNLYISKIIYEFKYAKSLFNFMKKCYNNIFVHYAFFLTSHNIKRQKHHKEYDLVLINIIFFTIFKLYFAAMHKKNKTSEPYLIDIHEMTALYNEKHFDNFYTNIFFNKASYNELIIQILDEVVSELYRNKWFIDYYTEETVFALIQYLLTNWYKNLVNTLTEENNLVY